MSNYLSRAEIFQKKNTDDYECPWKNNMQSALPQWIRWPASLASIGGRTSLDIIYNWSDRVQHVVGFEGQ